MKNMLNPKAFKKASDPIIDWIDNYLKNIADYPVKSKVTAWRYLQADS